MQYIQWANEDIKSSAQVDGFYNSSGVVRMDKSLWVGAERERAIGQRNFDRTLHSFNK